VSERTALSSTHERRSQYSIWGWVERRERARKAKEKRRSSNAAYYDRQKQAEKRRRAESVGTVAQWHSDTAAQWHSGTVAQRHADTPQGSPLYKEEKSERGRGDGPPPDLARESDRQTARAHVTSFPNSGYRMTLGMPPRCEPGDTLAAGIYCDKIERIQNQGGWTKAEWTRLRQMHEKWARRAAGLDPRFMAVGNIGGGLTEHQRRRVVLWRRIIANRYHVAPGTKVGGFTYTRRRPEGR
jgi:hypothetical protein